MIDGLNFFDYLNTIGKTEEYSWQEIAEIYGLASGNAARNVWGRYRRAKTDGRDFIPQAATLADKLEQSEAIKEANTANYIAELEESLITKILESETDHNTGNQKLTIQSSKPLSPKELEELAGVDNISTFIDRSWLKSHKNNTWTYSILTINKVKDFTPQKFLESLKGMDFSPIAINITKDDDSAQDEVDVEISIADFHLDRLTLQQNNIEARSKEFIATVQSLVRTTFKAYNVRKYIFIVGNDFFNSDNYQGATTAGTPQDNSVTWAVAYEQGFKVLAQAITILSTFGKEVDVVLVQGNHDRTKSFYLVHALEMFFSNTLHVHFKRDNSNTKFVVTGDTFIGYHHGNCKLDELPLLFATSPESSVQFGISKYREVHTADKHHYMAKEVKGVRIQQIPSMVNPDRWSTDGLYLNNVRAGLAFVYHPTKGKIAEFEERI